MMRYAIIRRRTRASSSFVTGSAEFENKRARRRSSVALLDITYSLYLPRTFWYDDSLIAFSWLRNWNMKISNVSVITIVCTIVASKLRSIAICLFYRHLWLIKGVCLNELLLVLSRETER